MTRKIIQIAVATDAQDDTDTTIIALCNDGTVWRMWASTEQWKRLPDIPQPAATGVAAPRRTLPP